MHNFDWKITGDKLVITMDISKKAIDAATPSKTGSTMLVGSTGAAMPLASDHCKNLRVQVNLMCGKNG